MANYTNPDGRQFTIPNYSDFSDGPQNFKDFAATMPSYGSELLTISAGDAAYEPKHLSRILWFQQGGEYTLNDDAPVGAQVSVATSNGFVSIMVDGVVAQPATERLVRPYSVVTCTKVDAGFWLVAKGSGAQGSYFNEATGGTVTEIADYNGSGELWRVHTFASSGSHTFTVTSDAAGAGTWRVLCGAGGGGGAGAIGNNAQGGVGGSGGAGGVLEDQSMTLPPGTHTITVGSGGGGGGGGHGGNGGASFLALEGGGNAIHTTGGGGGSGSTSTGGNSGGSGGGGCSFVGNWGGPSGGGAGILGQGTNGNGGGGQGVGPAAGGRAGNGLSVGYQGGGRPTTIRGTAETVSPGIAGNGGNGRDWQGPGSSGSNGIVIVAYQIG